MEIFGIGAAEMIIIGLVIVLVAGPRRSALWARELGRYVSQFRSYVNELLDEFQTELGPDGREFMDAARELRQNANEIRQITSPRQSLGKLTRMVEEMDPINKQESGSDKPAYPGWTKSTADSKQPAPKVADKPEQTEQPEEE